MTDLRSEESGTTTPTPPEVVLRLLDAVAGFDQDALEATLADDVAYTNVSLPTIHGRRAVGRALAERIDAIDVGRLRLQFWTRATLRALAGVLVSSLRPRFPESGSGITRTR